MGTKKVTGNKWMRERRGERERERERERRERERERGEREREEKSNTLLHRDKDLSTCRFFAKSIPDDKHSNTQYIKQKFT